MSSYRVEDGLLLQIETDATTGQSYAAYVHSLDSIPAYQAMLGTVDLAETVAAMNRIAEHGDGGPVDVRTGETVWHRAREAMRTLLSDSASTVSLLSDDGQVADDPLTATRNLVRGRCGLPVIPRETEALMLTASLNVSDGDATDTSTTGSGVDMSLVDETALREFLADEQVSARLETAEERFYESLMPTTEE